MYPDKISIDDTYWWPAPKDELVEYVRAPVWIPVSERLPDKQEDVLVTDDSENYFVAYITYFDDGFPVWFIDNGVSGNFKENVTHWMPLPSPPEADE